MNNFEEDGPERWKRMRSLGGVVSEIFFHRDYGIISVCGDYSNYLRIDYET